MTRPLSVFVCCTPRSGSSLLSDLLSSSQVMGGIGIEYFNPYVEQETCGLEGPFPSWADYLGHVLAAGTTAKWVAQLASDLTREYPFPFPAELPAPAFS